jgi:hypothetical protein
VVGIIEGGNLLLARATVKEIGEPMKEEVS